MFENSYRVSLSQIPWSTTLSTALLSSKFWFHEIFFNDFFVLFLFGRVLKNASAIERGAPRQPKQICKQKQKKFRIFIEFCEIFHVFSYFFQAVMLCKVFEKSPVTQKLIPERTQSLDVSLMESVESADGKKMERWENNWTHWTKKFFWAFKSR